MTESVIPLKEFDQEMASTRKLLEVSVRCSHVPLEPSPGHSLGAQH